MKIKRILPGLLLALLLVSQLQAVVLAEDVDTADTQEKTAEQIAAEEEQAKTASHDAPIDTNSLKNWPQGPHVYAESAIIMDMKSGAVLFGKNVDEKHYPASITKLLTTLVALDNAELTDKITFTDDSISFLEYGDASIGMTAGEQLSLEDSLYAILLASANEVSHAVAESVGATMGGNYDTFIAAMNTTAEQLGCTNSHWVNPNGLHDEQHYTSAHDMALIASAVYQNEEFRKVTKTLDYKIGPTNLVNEDRIFQQNHKMLWPENTYYYPYCTGGKTGYTDQSKTTLVTMADNGKMQLAAVILKDYGYVSYEDTRGMMDYVFDNFSEVPIAAKEDSLDIESFQDPDAYVVLPEGVEFSDLKKECIPSEDSKDKTGKVTYTYDGQNVGSAEVVFADKYWQKLTGTEESKITVKDVKAAANDNKGIFKNKKVLALIISAVAAVAVIIVISFMLAVKRRRMRSRRRRRQKRRKR